MKIELDPNDLGRIAADVFYPDPWDELSEGQREEWRGVGIAAAQFVLKSLAGALKTVKVTIKEADTADAPSEPPAGLRKAQYESDEDPF